MKERTKTRQWLTSVALFCATALGLTAFGAAPTATAVWDTDQIKAASDGTIAAVQGDFETAAEGYTLTLNTDNTVDTEKGVITIGGTKGVTFSIPEADRSHKFAVVFKYSGISAPENTANVIASSYGTTTSTHEVGVASTNGTLAAVGFYDANTPAYATSGNLSTSGGYALFTFDSSSGTRTYAGSSLSTLQGGTAGTLKFGGLTNSVISVGGPTGQRSGGTGSNIAWDGMKIEKIAFFKNSYFDSNSLKEFQFPSDAAGSYTATISAADTAFADIDWDDDKEMTDPTAAGCTITLTMADDASVILPATLSASALTANGGLVKVTGATTSTAEFAGTSQISIAEGASLALNDTSIKNTVTNNGTFVVSGGNVASIVNNGAATLSNGATVISTASLTNNGTLTLDGVTIPVGTTGTGTIVVGDDLGSAITAGFTGNLTTGGITVKEGATLTLANTTTLTGNVTGTGTIVMNNGKMVANWGADISIAPAINIPATSDSTISAYGGKYNSTKYYTHLKINGNISGTGVLRLMAEGNSEVTSTNFADVEVCGSLVEFKGTGYISQANYLHKVRFRSAGCRDQSESDWHVYETGAAPRHNSHGYQFYTFENDATFKFGSLNGNIYGYATSSGKKDSENVTFEVGYKNTACSLGGEFSRYGGYYQYNTIDWVATTATLTYSITDLDYLKLSGGGTVLLTDSAKVPRSGIAFTGDAGVVKFDTGVSGDLSALLKNSTATIVFDDNGSDNTWASAIAASNNGGFTKQGAGTLTLSAVPLYTGSTTVAGGTLIVPAGTTFDSLSVAEGSEVIVDGADGSTLTVTAFADEGSKARVRAAAGSSLDWDGTTATITRANQTFTWSGATSSAWSLPANWKLGEVVAETLPTSVDTVVFPELADAATPWSVTLDKNVSFPSVVFNGDTKITGWYEFKAEAFSGDGKIILNGTVLAAGGTVQEFTLSNNIEIADGTENQIRPPYYGTGSNDGVSLYLNGSLSGSGKVTFQMPNSSQRGGVVIGGDNTAFTGIGVFHRPNTRNWHHFTTPKATGTAARWEVGNAPTDAESGSYYLLGSATDKEWEIGAITGNIEKYRQDDDPENRNVTLTLGSRPEDSYLGGHWARARGENNYNSGVVWASAANTLYYSMEQTAFIKITSGGTVKITSTSGLPMKPKGTSQGIIFADNGGVLKTGYTVNMVSNVVTEAVYDGETLVSPAVYGEEYEVYTPIDPSAVLMNSSVAIVFDDEGTNRTWATALASSNTAGLKKLGTGTLTLSQAPAAGSSFVVTVAPEGGAVVLPEDSFTLGANTKVDTEAEVEEGFVKLVHFYAASVTVSEDTTYYDTYAEALAAAQAANLTEFDLVTEIDEALPVGWYIVGNKIAYNDDAIADVDGTPCTTVDAIGEACTSTSTITLLKNLDLSAESTLKLQAGQTLVLNGNTVTGMFGGKGTIVSNVSTFTPDFRTEQGEEEDEAPWTGTFVIDWTLGNGADLNKYGVDGSTIVVNKDWTGYFANKANVVPTVKFVGDLTISNGWGDGAAWGVNSTYLSTVTGSGDLNFTWVTSSTKVSYGIDVLSGYTGAISLTNTVCFGLGAVDFATEPAAGVPVVAISKTSSADVYVLNATTTNALTVGGGQYTIPVSVGGEASDAKLVLGSDGLYVAQAKYSVTTKTYDDPADPTSNYTETTTDYFYATVAEAITAAETANATIVMVLDDDYVAVEFAGWEFNNSTRVYTALPVVAQLDDTVYYSLSAAITDALALTGSHTLILVADYDVESLTIPAGLNLTLSVYSGTTTINAITVAGTFTPSGVTCTSYSVSGTLTLNTPAVETTVSLTDVAASAKVRNESVANVTVSTTLSSVLYKVTSETGTSYTEYTIAEKTIVIDNTTVRVDANGKLVDTNDDPVAVADGLPIMLDGYDVTEGFTVSEGVAALKSPELDEESEGEPFEVGTTTVTLKVKKVRGLYYGTAAVGALKNLARPATLTQYTGDTGTTTETPAKQGDAGFYRVYVDVKAAAE